MFLLAKPYKRLARFLCLGAGHRQEAGIRWKVLHQLSRQTVVDKEGLFVAEKQLSDKNRIGNSVPMAYLLQILCAPFVAAYYKPSKGNGASVRANP